MQVTPSDLDSNRAGSNKNPRPMASQDASDNLAKSMFVNKKQPSLTVEIQGQF
jgi:hypothetical protein